MHADTQALPEAWQWLPAPHAVGSQAGTHSAWPLQLKPGLQAPSAQPGRRCDSGTICWARDGLDHESETCAPVADGGASVETTLTGTLTDIAPGSDGATFPVSGGTVAVTVPPHGFRVLVAE